MNTAQLSAWFAGHKTVAVGAAAAGVAGIAYYKKRKDASSSSSTASTGTTSSTVGGTYDSSDDDVYNSLESQISQLSDELGGITSNTSPVTAPTAPSTTPATPSTGSTAPAPSTPSNAGNLITALLNETVGNLSNQLGKGTPTSVITSQGAAIAATQSWATASFADQEANVGYLSQGLKTPTAAQIQAAAPTVASGLGLNYGSLTQLQQNEINETANAQLLSKLNPK